MRTVKLAGSIGLIGALLTAACGDSSRSLNPTSPSAVVAVAQSVEASAAGGPKKNKPTPPATITPGSPVTSTPPSSVKVEVEGTIASIAGSSITVNSQSILVLASAVIRHGSRQFSFSDLQVGDRVHVRASHNGTQLEASEVKLQNPAGGDADDDDEDDKPYAPEVEIQGTISLLTGACPAIAFTVGTTKVKTGTATKFKDGTCAAIRNGNRVEVKGTPQTDGILLAAVVEVDR